ncbi:coadhesin-like [Saccostrea cucullata]|uniref:coadhesin-like n=1 Tax=Saccostrea cuccullata TaxID=36930 RepID=UPI002ED455B5
MTDSGVQCCTVGAYSNVQGCTKNNNVVCNKCRQLCYSSMKSEATVNNEIGKENANPKGPQASIHGGWSTWGPYDRWSVCTVTCGGGVQQSLRTRECNNPKPENGGRVCEGPQEDKKEKACNSQPCPVNGQWSLFVPFGDWSQCSSSCNNGTRTRARIRYCSNPIPLYGGKPCVGQSLSTETLTCNLKQCVGKILLLLYA